MTTPSRRAEQADRDRLHGWDDHPEPWHCPRHHACTCPPPQPPECCPTHGPYQPTGMDASCPTCDADQRDYIARFDAWHDYLHTRH